MKITNRLNSSHSSLRYRAFLALAALSFFFLPSSSRASSENTSSMLERPAHFKVQTQVVNPDVKAFAATTGRIGNSNVWTVGGFEPPIVRDAFLTTDDGPDEIHADAVTLTHWDIFTERILEGAEVKVWRVTNGAMRLVRLDHVVRGGARLRGWWPMYDPSRVIPAENHGFYWRWAGWNAPDSRYWFCIRSVTSGGQESECSTAVVVTSPHDLRARGAPEEATEVFAKSHVLLESVPPPPSDFRAEVTADGGVQFHWASKPASVIAGYRIYRSDYPPETHNGYSLLLEKKAGKPEERIQRGDWVMWERKLYTVSPNDFSHRIWNSAEGFYRYTVDGVDFPSDDSSGRRWELVRHAPDSPVTDHGETYLRLTLGAGQKARIGLLNNGGAQEDGFEPLKPGPWLVSAWLRQETGGEGKVELLVTGPNDRFISRTRPGRFNVGDKWKLQFESMRVRDYDRGKGVGWMGLEFTGPATFCIDNFNIGRADVEFLALPPEWRKALHESGMRALRTHMLWPSSTLGFDLAQYTNGGGAIHGVNGRMTLPQVLKIMKSAEVDPWLQSPIYFTPDEWRALVEYLGAPFDPSVDRPEAKPWAFKRYSQGHPQPWTDDFNFFHFELGNETWNRMFMPWNWPSMRDAATGKQYSAGEVYGLYQEQVIRAMKSSPWWKTSGLEKKAKFVIGGWIINEDFSFGAARQSLSSDYLTVAAYNGGWDWGQGPRPDALPSYFEILNDVSQSAIPFADAFQRAIERLNHDRSHKLELGIYEAGPGYSQNGLNGQAVSKSQAEAQERVMKSLASGTATLDAYLARAYRGFTLQNYFTFETGVRWTSHQNWLHGGQAWPAWKLLSLFNTQGTGDMLRIDTQSVPSWNLPDVMTKKASPEVPLVGAYALRRGQRFMLFLMSRKVAGYPFETSSGFTPVDIELPFRRFGKAKVYRTVGSFDDNNVDEDRVRIEEVGLDHPLTDGHLRLGPTSGTTTQGLAPGSTLLYVFEDTDLPRSRAGSGP